MIKLTDILNEGVMSPVLYHITSASRAANILDENQFRLTPAFGTPSDMKKQKGKLYFLSTSRIKYGGYSRSLSDVGNVNFELDGRKLNQNYTSVNVDYWGRDWRDIDWQKGDLQRFLRNDENEERIISDDATIKPANKFIKSIHVSVGNPDDLKQGTKKYFRKLDKLAQKRNVDAYFYTDPEAWKLHDTRNAYQSTERLFSYDPSDDEEGFSMGAYDTKIKGFLSLFNANSPDDLSENGREIYDKLKGGSYPMDYVSIIQNQIHNYKSSPESLDRIEKLAAIMKRNNVSSVKGLIELGVEKAKKLRKQDKKDLKREYQSFVDSVMDIYNNASNKSEPDLSDLNYASSIDGIDKYFPYSDGDFDDWPNSVQEKAFGLSNDLRELLNLGFFSELENALSSENYSNSRFVEFMNDVIQPLVEEIARNEGWDFFFK